MRSDVNITVYILTDRRTSVLSQKNTLHIWVHPLGSVAEALHVARNPGG